VSIDQFFQDVLDKLSDVGKKDKLLKFFKLVQDGKFPLHSIAFELFLDIVEWFDKDESRRNEILFCKVEVLCVSTYLLTTVTGSGDILILVDIKSTSLHKTLGSGMFSHTVWYIAISW
jgi:hypothetical protein